MPSCYERLDREVGSSPKGGRKSEPDCRNLSGGALALLLIFFLMPTLAGAGQLNLRLYDTRDGIPQIQISSVRQDELGYLWVGTYGGLARYNGNRFEVFRTDAGLSTSYINVVESDTRGTVWVGTARGLCRRKAGQFNCFNPDNVDELMVNDLQIDGRMLWVAADEGLFVFENDQFEPVEGWAGLTKSAVVHALALDDNGHLWVGGQEGLFMLAAAELERQPIPGQSPAVYDLEFHEGELWIGSNGTLFRLDPVTGGIEERSLPIPPGTRIDDIAFDSGGNLWAATPEGLIRGGSEGPELLTTREGLSNNRTLSLEQDQEGLMWIGSDQGLMKVLPGPFEGFSTQNGLLASFVRTINEDDQDRLWLGTREGLQIVTKRDGRWRFDESRPILRSDGLPDNRIYSIAFTGRGSAWIATGQGVAHWHDEEGVTELIDAGDGLPSEEIHSLLIDGGDRLWIGSTRGVRWRENGELQTPSDGKLAQAFALRIREDSAGRLWFATLRHGLLIREPDGTVTSYQAAEGLTDEMLWDLAPSPNGSMWVGSNGDGIFRVWPDGRIEQYTSRDGLVDDSVWQVLEDDRGRLWAYTNRGLSRMEDDNFVNYSERDGLLHLEGGATGAFQTGDGMLWFASADGLMRYDPDGEYSNSVAPPVVIESVELDRQPVESGQRLPHRPGSLAIYYAGLSYQDEQAVRFRYRLLGAGERWSEPTENRQVTYANLGHGEYQFEVMARNPDGIWSEHPSRFEFSVAAPFWASTWFILLCGATLALLVWGVIHLRLRQIEATRRRLQHLVGRRTAELSEANDRLRHMARSDQLTGLPNRRYLFDRIGDDIARSRRAHHDDDPVNGDVAFLMVDLDNFKQINDIHGHDAGDRILLEFSRTLGRQLRDSDYMIRWGGEEFLVVACQAECGQAHQIAERMIEGVRANRFTIEDAGQDLALTCSIGIACYPFGEPIDALDWEQVVQLADVAVYQAKGAGRDRWVQLEPGESLVVSSGDEFMQQVKETPDQLIAQGQLRRREGG